MREPLRPANCADDLTIEDLSSNVSAEVLERVSAGEGSNSTLWGHIDRNNPENNGERGKAYASVVGLNLDVLDSAPTVIKTWDDRLVEEGVESGVDDELILHIPFTSSLRLRQLLLRTPAPTHPNRPTRLRIFANLTYCPDFGELDSLTPVMDLAVGDPPPTFRRGVAGEREVEEWGLKVQKMASSEASGAHRSAVWYVGFKGDAKTHSMDMSKLGQIPAAHAADSPVDQVAEKKGSGYANVR